MLQLENIDKAYLLKPIISNLSFIFNHGVYALIGANGTGKTTLLSLMSGSIEPNRGNILINNISLIDHPIEAKKNLGFSPDAVNFYPFLSGRDLLDFICSVKKVNYDREASEFVKKFNLGPHYDEKLSQMSLGTRKKYFITAAFISNPSVILMDEPTVSLDENAKSVLYEYININRHKKTIVFSSHDMDFIKKISAIPLYLSNLPVTKFS